MDPLQELPLLLSARFHPYCILYPSIRIRLDMYDKLEPQRIYRRFIKTAFGSDKKTVKQTRLQDIKNL